MNLLLIVIILWFIARYKKGTKISKILNILATIILVVFIGSNIINYMMLNNTKISISTVDTSNINVELNGYDKTSAPIGIGKYAFEVSPYDRNKMIFCLDVRKNSNSPWYGAISAEIEFFDEQNNSIGKDIAKSDSLKMDMGDTLEFVFSTKDGKIVHNQREICKIALINIYEKNDLHKFKKSNFNSKKIELQRCIDENNYDLFYSKLKDVRTEYPRDEFPEENVVLDNIEHKVNEITNSTDTPQ